MICEFELEKSIEGKYICLTPNHREFELLCKCFQSNNGMELSLKLSNWTIMKKGFEDRIFYFGNESIL